MFLVSLSIGRDEVEIIIRIDENLDLLVGAWTHSVVFLSTRGQELQGAEIDVEGGVLYHRHLQRGQVPCILIVDDCVDVE